MLNGLDHPTARYPWTVPNVSNVVPQASHIPVPTLPSQPSTPVNQPLQGTQATLLNGHAFTCPRTRAQSIVQSGVTSVNTSVGLSASQVGPEEQIVDATKHMYNRYNTRYRQTPLGSIPKVVENYQKPQVSIVSVENTNYEPVSMEMENVNCHLSARCISSIFCSTSQ